MKDFLSSLSRKQFLELEACVRCNACLEWCAVQEATGERELSPPSKISSYKDFVNSQHGIGRLWKGKLEEKDILDFMEGLYTCTTCGACGETCEVGIDTQKLWWTMRRGMVGMGYTAPSETLDTQFENARMYHSIFPSPLDQRYRIWLPPQVEVAREAELCYFEGCGVAWEAPPMAEGAGRMLNAAGREFTLLEASEAWCCGWPLAVVGRWELQEELVENNIARLEEKGVSTLAVSCPCCLQQIREVWSSYGRLPFEVRHITEIVAQALEEGSLEFGQRREEKVTYHDPCQLTRGFRGPRVYEAPRAIIESLPGVEMVELEREGRLTKCCGAGGGIRAVNPRAALEIGKMFLRDAENTGAHTLLMDCPACYAMYVARRLPEPQGREWKAYRSGVKCNDILQYAARFL